MAKRSVYYMHVNGTSFRPESFSPEFKDDMPAGDISISVEQSTPYNVAIVDDIIDSNCDRRYSSVPVNTDGSYDDTIVFDDFGNLRDGIKHVIESTKAAGCLSSAKLTVYNTSFNYDNKQVLKQDAENLGCDYFETDDLYKSSESKGLDNYSQLMDMAKKLGFNSNSVQNSGPDIV